MTTLFEKIKRDQIEARKKKALEVPLLTTLIGEAGKLGKDAHGGDPTDQEVVTTVKKFIKNINDLLTHSVDNPTALFEKSILEAYLPQQLTRLEIVNILIDGQYNFKDKKVLGTVMGDFKKRFEGRYDAALVKSTIESMQKEQ